VQQWIAAAGAGAPEPLASSLASIRRPDFHYSRLMAVGLLSLLEEAQGAASLDLSALRASAHDLAVAMGLLRERVDKDISLYAGNLEKMAQAVELMEETVAADRRRRERSEASSPTPSKEASSETAPPTAD
ncbi:MAG: photosystem II biogenesis protein Psp29, partial [Cyanobacteriota bacterium]